MIIAPLIKRGNLPDNNCLLYWDYPCSLLIVWGLDGPPRPMDLGAAHHLHTRSTATDVARDNETLNSIKCIILFVLLDTYIYPKIIRLCLYYVKVIWCTFFFNDYIAAKKTKERATWGGNGLRKLKVAFSSFTNFKRKPEKPCVQEETDIHETVN